MVIRSDTRTRVRKLDDNMHIVEEPPQLRQYPCNHEQVIKCIKDTANLESGQFPQARGIESHWACSKVGVTKGFMIKSATPVHETDGDQVACRLNSQNKHLYDMILESMTAEAKRFFTWGQTVKPFDLDAIDGLSIRLLLQITLLVLLLQASAHVIAQPQPLKTTAQPLVSVTQPSASISEPAELAVAKQHVKVLESQIQLMREHQGSLLDTVYWALGGVFLVVSLLLGFGWFVNFKVYERDKESLKSDLATSAEKTSSELEQSVKAQIEAISIKLSNSLENLVVNAVKPYATSVATIEKQLFRLQFARLKENMKANTHDDVAFKDALNLLELCQEVIKKRPPLTVLSDFTQDEQNEILDILNFILSKLDKGVLRLSMQEDFRLNAILDAQPPHYKPLTDKIRAKIVLE